MQGIGKGLATNMSMTENLCFRKRGHPQNAEQPQRWEQTQTSDTLNVFDNTDVRTPTLIVEGGCYDARGNGSGFLSPTITGDHQDRITDYTAIYCGRRNKMENGTVVRRLTPLECERLQGYPDGWTDIGEWVDSNGKKHKDADSPRYKALGNSIALPFWAWMAQRMAAYLPENATMASLFSGIGGFEYVYLKAGVTPVWASEIEEFAIAVTKKHFGEGKELGGDHADYNL